MTPEEFVVALKRSTRRLAESQMEYVANPPVAEPPGHLGDFARLWRSLDASQREVLKDLITWTAEGALFDLLNVLDDMVTLESRPPGRLELRWVSEDGASVRLNDPENGLLYDIFNNVP